MTDAITSALVTMLLQRAATGRKKYGRTMERADLTLGQWCQHAAEESLDHAAYTMRIKEGAGLLEEAFGLLQLLRAGEKIDACVLDDWLARYRRGFGDSTSDPIPYGPPNVLDDDLDAAKPGSREPGPGGSAFHSSSRPGGGQS